VVIRTREAILAALLGLAAAIPLGACSSPAPPASPVAGTVPVVTATKTVTRTVTATATGTAEGRVTCMFEDYDGTTEVGMTVNDTSCLLQIQVLSRAGRTWYPVTRMDKLGTRFGPGGSDGTEAEICDLTDSTGTEELLVDDTATPPYDVTAADVCAGAESGLIGAVANGSGSQDWTAEPAPGPLATRLTPASTAPVATAPAATAPANSAVAVYPEWSAPGQVVPAWLQPYTPHLNGATAFTIVNCNAYQCTGYSGAGPDGSTCGQVVQGEQVCVR